MKIPDYIEELLDDLVESLRVPKSRFVAAEKRFNAIKNWLYRSKSCLNSAKPNIYPQGSFRLGTVIRPMRENEDYDIDLVCELSLSKKDFTQANLKQLVGKELKAYAKTHGMRKPVESRRCWTQDYADEVQFHVDILPAIPDANTQRKKFEQMGKPNQWVDTAIAITDRNCPNFSRLTQDWPHSNPNGYAKWFHSQMKEIFDKKRIALANKNQVSVEELPDYLILTPLQKAIMLLKHHRDMMFNRCTDIKPISIIITTLAAHSYQNEQTISETLNRLLADMEIYIQYRNGIKWVANPTDPLENFADKWQEHPEREKAFYDWLSQVKTDFNQILKSENRLEAEEILKPQFGNELLEKAKQIIKRPKLPPWPICYQGIVEISKVTVQRKGFRQKQPKKESNILPKNCKIYFQACTGIQKPFNIYWQIINTGDEAAKANDLRGGFEEGNLNNSIPHKEETTRYSGKHSIECFIVKDGYLAASSGKYIVNIQ